MISWDTHEADGRSPTRTLSGGQEVANVDARLTKNRSERTSAMLSSWRGNALKNAGNVRVVESHVLCCATHVNRGSTDAAGTVINGELHAGRHVR